MSIQVQNLSKFYGTQKALDNVSFEVGNGEILGLLGPNGAGKSTLMKILSCTLEDYQGEAFVSEMNCATNALSVKKQVGYLPEHNPLYLDMYVREFLEFVGGMYLSKNLVAHKVEQTIKMVGLSPEAHKKIGQLSKGYRQRTGLAQALIHDPKVLILDEPTTGLDPNQIEEIRDLIRKLGKDRTIILSTHIMQEVEAICNRVLILNHGKIVANKTPGELKSEKSKVDRILVEFNACPMMENLKRIEGLVRVEETDAPTRFFITGDNSSDIRIKVFEFAVKENLQVLTLKQDETTLDEAFHQLTQ